MNFPRMIWAYFLGIQTAALFACVALMVLEDGPLAILEGLGTWVFGQLVIMPVAIVAAPVFLTVRYMLARTFQREKLVAVLSGAIIGGLGALALSVQAQQTWFVHWVWPLIGTLSGVCGGWVWWRVEFGAPKELTAGREPQ